MFVGVSGELDADVVFSAWIISCRAALSIAAARNRITGSDTRRALMASSTGPGLPVAARLCVKRRVGERQIPGNAVVGPGLVAWPTRLS